MKFPDKIWHNGVIKPWAEATTHVMAHAIHYGSSVFEGLRAYETPKGTAIFRLHDHTKRLFQSAKIDDIDIPFTADEINAACREIIRANGLGKAAHETKSKQARVETQISQRDLQCLAEALYFEARGEGSQGQRAVAEVILNRVDHPRFPKTVCGVVNQRGQFTYNKNARIREKGTFARVQKVAMAALSGQPRTLTNGATYFHTGRVKPSW